MVKVTCQRMPAEREHWHGGSGLEEGTGPGGRGRGRERALPPGVWAALTLEAASAVSARVHPGGAVVADAPHHALAAGLHHPQVATHLPPEPGSRGEGVGDASRQGLQPCGLWPLGTSCSLDSGLPVTGRWDLPGFPSGINPG